MDMTVDMDANKDEYSRKKIGSQFINLENQTRHKHTYDEYDEFKWNVTAIASVANLPTAINLLNLWDDDHVEWAHFEKSLPASPGF